MTRNKEQLFTDPSPLPLGFFSPSLNKFSGNPYLKILDISQLFVADARIKIDPKI